MTAFNLRHTSNGGSRLPCISILLLIVLSIFFFCKYWYASFDLEDANQNLDTLETKYESLQAKFKETDSKLRVAINNKVDLNDQLDKLHTALAEEQALRRKDTLGAQNLNKRLMETKNEIARVNREKEALNTTCTGLHRQVESCQEAGRTTESLRRELVALRYQYQALKDNCSAFQNYLETVIKPEYMRAAEENSHLTAENTRLQELLSTLQTFARKIAGGDPGAIFTSFTAEPGKATLKEEPPLTLPPFQAPPAVHTAVQPDSIADSATIADKEKSKGAEINNIPIAKPEASNVTWIPPMLEENIPEYLEEETTTAPTSPPGVGSKKKPSNSAEVIEEEVEIVANKPVVTTTTTSTTATTSIAEAIAKQANKADNMAPEQEELLRLNALNQPGATLEPLNGTIEDKQPEGAPEQAELNRVNQLKADPQAQDQNQTIVVIEPLQQPPNKKDTDKNSENGRKEEISGHGPVKLVTVGPPAAKAAAAPAANKPKEDHQQAPQQQGLSPQELELLRANNENPSQVSAAENATSMPNPAEPDAQHAELLRLNNLQGAPDDKSPDENKEIQPGNIPKPPVPKEDSVAAQKAKDASLPKQQQEEVVINPLANFAAKQAETPPLQPQLAPPLDHGGSNLLKQISNDAQAALDKADPEAKLTQVSGTTEKPAADVQRERSNENEKEASIVDLSNPKAVSGDKETRKKKTDDHKAIADSAANQKHQAEVPEIGAADSNKKQNQDNDDGSKETNDEPIKVDDQTALKA